MKGNKGQKKIRLLYLDCDGCINKGSDNCAPDRHIYNDRFSQVVLNRDGTTCEQTYVDPELAARVSKLITDFDLYIVASTSWRLFYTKEDFKELLTLRGLPGERLIGYTPNLMGASSWAAYTTTRADEIRAFLRDFKEPVEFCIILDDLREAGVVGVPNIMFCKTDFDLGYTEQDDLEVRKWIEDFLKKEKNGAKSN